MKTRKQYMNGEISHFEYYSQFVTEATKRFVSNELSIEDIKEALDNGDKHLNKLKIPFNNKGRGGGWWWDLSPMNVALVKDSGENNSPSTHTCVGKAAAKMLVIDSKWG